MRRNEIFVTIVFAVLVAVATGLRGENHRSQQRRDISREPLSLQNEKAEVGIVVLGNKKHSNHQPISRKISISRLDWDPFLDGDDDCMWLFHNDYSMEMKRFLMKP